jgi:hypothetical protein
VAAMTALNYVTVEGGFDDGSGSPIDGTATFTPSANVFVESGPVAFASVAVQALITSGQLQALDGSPLQLLATDNDVVIEGPSPEWLWTVALELGSGASVVTDSWQFALPSSPATVQLYSTRNPA